MTLDDRTEIQGCLDHGMTFKAIGARINKDQTTVSKEVKKHITYTSPNVKRYDSQGNPIDGLICPKLMKAPFVCNPCEFAKRACSYTKHRYVASKAQEEYESLLSESREGIPLNKKEFYAMDRIISDGVIDKGQHLYHVIKANNLNVATSTVYRYLHKDYLSIGKMDTPRMVKFKARETKAQDYVPKGLKIGRTYNDFLTFIEDNRISSWVEMDTVVGRPGGKVILTMTFTSSNFIIGILLNNKTSAELSEKIIEFKRSLVGCGLRFGDIFPLVITDNGGEFSDIFSIINDLDGNMETDLFFCDPYQSSQKPRIEKNHTLLRDIVHKGTSFDSLNQDDVNLIMSHINGVIRKGQNDKSAYDVFSFTFNAWVTHVLGITHIPPSDVIQSTKLLNQILSGK